MGYNYATAFPSDTLYAEIMLAASLKYQSIVYDEGELAIELDTLKKTARVTGGVSMVFSWKELGFT